MRRGSWFQWLFGGVVVLILATGIAFYERPVSFFNGFTYLQESMGGIQSRSCTVEGHRMHYIAEGPANGAVVVLVHGLGGRAEDWLNLAPYLARVGFRVYMPDLFGYGRSDKPADFSYSVRDEATAVVGFLDALHLQKVDMGGWSMGGWIVQLVATEHPERIRRLMIFDSVGLHVEPDWNTNLFTPTSAAQLDQLDALLMPNPPQVPDFIVRDILRQSRQGAWVIHRAMNSMLSGQDTTDALLPQLKMPVLLSWGALDHITPLAQGETMHRLIPQSQLVIIPGCGHLAPRQCTGQEGPKVAAFLSARYQ